MQEIFQQITWTQYFGVLFSMAQVVLAWKNKSINYLFGIAGIILTLYVMFEAKLYGEFTLSLYYLVMSIYGYLFWKFGKDKHQVAISETTGEQKVVATAILVGSFTFFYWFLTQHTDSDVPLWDALVTCFAWAGMWLMAKRKIENWLVLNASNIIAIPLMIHKELYLYALLSGFLFVIAIFGYLKWKKLLKSPAYAI